MAETENKLVSIIVPIYQVEKYLEKCIESIIAQSYQELQIILVDDGSTDGSGRLCDYYAAIDGRIEVIHKDNGGLVSARKIGLEKARGKYVGFVDGDDYIEKGMFERLVNVIQTEESDMVHSGYFAISNERVEQLGKADIFSRQIDTRAERNELIYNCFFGNKKNCYMTPSIWSKLFKADFIKYNYALVPDRQDYGEDLLCLYCCLMNCRKISVIDEAYYCYMVREGSLSNISGERYFINEIRLYNELYRINERLSAPMESDVLFKWIRGKTLSLLIHTMGANTQFGMEQYFFGNVEKIEGRKVIIYGAGNVGRGYLLQMLDLEGCSVVCVADSNSNNVKWNSVEVCAPNEAIKNEFDYIVIALWNENDASIVRNELISLGVKQDKIIWEKPCF